MRRFAWTLWTIYALTWTTALLATFPLQAREMIVPGNYFFLTGKLLHVSAYMVFTLLTALLPLSSAGRRLVLLFVIVHAPLTEFLQQFTGRTCSLMDVGYDLLGVGLGVGLSWRRWWQEPAG